MDGQLPEIYLREVWGQVMAMNSQNQLAMNVVSGLDLCQNVCNNDHENPTNFYLFY